MADTWKDRRKAKIKRGEQRYERNNPRGKYERPGKHELPKNELEKLPAVKGGFFAALKENVAGLVDDALDKLKLGKK